MTTTPDDLFEGRGSILVLLGNGDGTFLTSGSFQPALSTEAGDGPVAMAAGDFNHDGIPDLTVVSFVAQEIWVLLGNGDGTFQRTSTLATAINPVALIVADINGDAQEDLAVTGLGRYSGDPGTLSVFLGDGDGTFREPRTIPTSAEPYSFAAGDFNDDGLRTWRYHIGSPVMSRWCSEMATGPSRQRNTSARPSIRSGWQ